MKPTAKPLAAPKATLRTNRLGAHLAWSGEVTAVTRDEVWNRTTLLLDSRAQAGGEVAIDLGQVRFVDGAGLGLMVRVRRTAHHYGIPLRFLNAGDAVSRIVRLAKLENFLLGEAA